MMAGNDNHGNDYEDEDENEDDEATLDEEDALNEGVDYDTELKELKEEGEMSLEELCRKYYGEKAPYSDDTNLQGSHGQCKEEHKREADIPPSTSTTTRNLRGKVLSAIATASETSTQYFKVEDLDEDDSDDYIPPPEIWKKEVRLGPEYQVINIPEFVQTTKRNMKTTACQPIEVSEVIWMASPEICPEQQIIDYLIECEQIRAGEKPKNGQVQKRRARSTTSSTTSSFEIVPDDENALQALYQAGYDLNSAKTKAPFEWPALCSANGPRLTQPSGSWRTWTEQDCINFESGLLEYGKQFWKIRQDFLPNRMVGEIVCFYYSWKKSERHDLWMAEKCRREQQMDAKTSDLMGRIVHTIFHEDIQQDLIESKKIAIDASGTTLTTASTTTKDSDSSA